MERVEPGVKKIVAAAFTDETDPALEQHVELVEWMRVGQLGRLLKFFRSQDIHHAIMAGQIAPKNLFDLRPDLKALMLLGKLKERNAESIFAAIADELAKIDVDLLPATTFLEDSLAQSGLIAGPKLSPPRRARRRAWLECRERNCATRYRANDHHQKRHDRCGRSFGRNKRGHQTRWNACA